MNKQEIIENIKADSSTFENMPEEIRADKEVVLEAVKSDGLILRNASEQLKNDREIVFEAVKNKNSALRFASDKLKTDKDFLKQISKLKNFKIDYIPKQLRKDVAFMKDISALAHDDLIIEYTMIIEKGDLRLIAEGPMLRIAEGAMPMLDITFYLENMRVEDINGKLLTPVIDEIAIKQITYYYSRWRDISETGFSIIDEKIYFEQIKYGSDLNGSETSFIFNTIKEGKNLKCTFDELAQYIEPCEPVKSTEKYMFSMYESIISDFQKDFKLTGFNEDIMSWDGNILTIKPQ